MSSEVRIEKFRTVGSTGRLPQLLSEAWPTFANAVSDIEIYISTHSN